MKAIVPALLALAILPGAAFAHAGHHHGGKAAASHAAHRKAKSPSRTAKAHKMGGKMMKGSMKNMPINHKMKGGMKMPMNHKM